MGVTPEKDRPGFEPHDVCLTFDKKYGVCRDKAGLLVAMLRTAGFEAYPVLTSVGKQGDPGIPDYFFNHAIVAVSLKPGQYTLMDPTDEKRAICCLPRKPTKATWSAAGGGGSAPDARAVAGRQHDADPHHGLVERGGAS